MICDHFRKPAAGDGVQHPEAAVVGVGVLQGAPQIHLVHGRKPCPVQGAVGLVQLVVIRALHGGKGRIGLHPSADERPLFGGALGRKIPQDAGLHGGALVDQLVHNAAVQPGDGGALIGHDLHQPVFLQFLQNHPDHAAGGRKAAAQRVFAQQGAGADGQIDDLPLQHGVNFSIGSILFHTSHLMNMMYLLCKYDVVLRTNDVLPLCSKNDVCPGGHNAGALPPAGRQWPPQAAASFPAEPEHHLSHRDNIISP